MTRTHGATISSALIAWTLAAFGAGPAFGQGENVTWFHVFPVLTKFERFEGRGFLCADGKDKYRATLADQDLKFEARVQVHKDDTITLLFRSTDPGWQKLHGRATLHKYQGGSSSFELFGISADGAYVGLLTSADASSARKAMPTCRN
jgi:hypothetical protein